MNLRHHIFPLLRPTRILTAVVFVVAIVVVVIEHVVDQTFLFFRGHDIFGSTQVKTRPQFSGWRLFMQTHVAVFAHDRRLLLARRRK